MPTERQESVQDLAIYVRDSMGKEGTYSTEGAKIHAKNVCRLVPTMTLDYNLVSFYKRHRPKILSELLSRLENIIHTYIK